VPYYQEVANLIKKLPADFSIGHYCGGKFVESFEISAQERQIIMDALRELAGLPAAAS